MMTDGPCRLFWWLGAILTEAGKWFNAQTTTVSRIILPGGKMAWLRRRRVCCVIFNFLWSNSIGRLDILPMFLYHTIP